MTPYSHVVQKSCILDRYYVTVMHRKVRKETRCEHWRSVINSYRKYIFLQSQCFFLHPSSKANNLEVRYSIQATESLIFTNLEISIFCMGQETNQLVFNKLQVQKRFRIKLVLWSLLLQYDLFYCSVLKNNSSSHVQSLTVYFYSVMRLTVATQQTFLANQDIRMWLTVTPPCKVGA